MQFIIFLASAAPPPALNPRPSLDAVPQSSEAGAPPPPLLAPPLPPRRPWALSATGTIRKSARRESFRVVIHELLHGGGVLVQMYERVRLSARLRSCRRARCRVNLEPRPGVRRMPYNPDSEFDQPFLDPRPGSCPFVRGR